MPETLVSHLKKTDWVYLLLCVFSSVFSCVLLVSIGHAKGGFTLDEAGAYAGLGQYRSAFVQAAASLMGVVLAVSLSAIDYRSLARIWPIHVAVTWGLVLPTLVLHSVKLGPLTIGYNADSTTNYSWYKLGGFTLQPTEFAKISFILTFAMHLDNVREHINEPKELAKLLLHMLVPMGIIHIQGDDGTAIIFGIIACSMLFAAGLSWKYIGGAAAALVSVAAIAFGFFSDRIGEAYQWYRILAIADPDNKTGWATTSAIYEKYTYQQQRGEISIGAGQIFGRGLFTGNYVSIPYAQNDFIFSWMGNAMGFVGCAAALIVLFIIVFKTFGTAVRSTDLLGTYICCGVGGAILAQIIVNVGMNLRVLPVIGITLPFYSAGGSSATMLYISIGLVMSVYVHNKRTLFSDN